MSSDECMSLCDERAMVQGILKKDEECVLRFV